MTPYRFHVFHMSTWIHSGANRTPPLDVPFEKRCDSPMCFSECIRCSLVILIWRFIYIVRRTSRCPPSHTTHSVGSTGLALWVYAVCGVWGGWVGSLRW